MYEAELSRMKVVAGIAGQGAGIGCRDTARHIKRIAYKRVPCCCQMDPDLMGPAGFDVNVAQKTVLPPFQDSYLREGRFPVRRRSMQSLEQLVIHRADRRGDRLLIP